MRAYFLKKRKVQPLKFGLRLPITKQALVLKLFESVTLEFT